MLIKLAPYLRRYNLQDFDLISSKLSTRGPDNDERLPKSINLAAEFQQNPTFSILGHVRFNSNPYELKWIEWVLSPKMGRRSTGDDADGPRVRRISEGS